MITAPYIIVTPVRNEQEFLPNTLRAVHAQTQRPLCWALVDDGSTDRTFSLILDAAAACDYILPVSRKDRGYRLSGSGVVEAFYDGFNRLAHKPWRFVAKLDGDLSFPPDYFAQCLRRFQENPRLGIAGGTICRREDAQLVPESNKDPRFHVRGAVKIYRRECWDQIGGLVTGPCWDSIDELKANMLGWDTGTFKDLKVHHHRPAGQAYGAWKDWVKGGRGNYVTGYHPLFMILKCISRIPARPYGVAACGLLFGFLSGYAARTPRLVDQQLMAYIRAQQLRHLFGKPSLWSERVSYEAEASR